MGAFSDINGIMYNGYKVVYNNDREMFKDKSAKNLFSSTNYYPIGRRENTYNEETEWNSNPPPYLDYQVLPNYITDASYLFFFNGGGDPYLNLQFSTNLKNVSHMFAFCPSWEGAGTAFDPNNGIHGIHYPDSIEDASGLFKSCTFGVGRAINFIRNMPQNLKSLNNTFFCTYGMYGSYLPMKDSNNNYILDKYENFFDLWSNQGGFSYSSSNFMYYANYYYCNNENGYDDRRFVNSTIPDSVEYMNGTFALSSIGIDDWELTRENNIDFHLPNNLKDASFCFFNTSYVSNFRFTLPDSLTEANYMFAGAYGGNFPNQIIFGNNLVNAAGMFGQLCYGYYGRLDNEVFPQEELPATLKNARQMFYGCYLNKLFNLPRSVEDASFMYSPGGQGDRFYGINNYNYTIPNTVKNIDFMFANINISPNNYYLFCKNLFFGKPNPLENFVPSFYLSPSYLYNFNLYFEENSNLTSLTGLFMGVTLNECNFEVPNSVKDIPFLAFASGSYYTDDFFNRTLKENVENAAWAFCYGYCNKDTTINMPLNLKNAAGMFSNLYPINWEDPYFNFNFVNLENTKIENAAYFLNGTYCFNQPINFPNTVKDLSYGFYGCSNFIGEYPVEGQVDNWVFSLENLTNLEKCDGLFAWCSNFNVNVVFPNSLTTMSQVFLGCENFNQNILLPEGLTSAYQLFSGCNNFDQDIRLPQTLENAAYLFSGCSNFNFNGQSVLDFSYLTNLKDMSYMFDNCYNLNKVINEQTFQWPPHVEQITSIFNNCPFIEIETFTIPSSIKEGKNILSGTTITNGILIEGGSGFLSSPFGELNGKEIGVDGNYYFNSIIIELGNGNISLSSDTTFYNTNVKDIIFKNGNLSMLGYDYYNEVDSIGFIINNSNKFNGNILFDNVTSIYGDTGRFSIRYCNNFNKPITFPPFVHSNIERESYGESYLILGDAPKQDPYASGYIGNYFYISVNEEAEEGSEYRAYYSYQFSENNSEFKEALNQLINSPSDLLNVYYNRNNYPLLDFGTSINAVAKDIIYNCENFNSTLRFDYGTESMSNIVSHCPNFNGSIEIPSSVTYIDGLVVDCINYNRLVVIPGSVQKVVNAFVGCPNFNTAPMLGEGIKSLDEMFYGSQVFNKTVFLPESLENARFLFGNCFNYNQETSFKKTKMLAGALSGCYNYNSMTYFNTAEERNITEIFNGDSLFNKEVDFNCPSIINADRAFSGCYSFNSNVINSNFLYSQRNYFEGGDRIFSYENIGKVDYGVNTGLSLRGHNFFYYPAIYDALENNNFYQYNTVNYYGTAIGMFSGCQSFNAEQIPNFHNCIDVTNLFRSCYYFNQPVDLFEAININNAFYGCQNFNQQLFFNSEVIRMGNAFANCYNLSYIPVFSKGIRISPNDSYWYGWQWNSQNAFYHCYNLGKDQQGEEYAINFSSIVPGYNKTEYGHSYISGGISFFEGCRNLNVPLNIDKIDGLPNRFLANCTNFNSNIYINRSIYDDYDSYYYELNLTGVQTFLNCSNYNKPFILTEGFFINRLGGSDFFNGCKNYNQPIQELFRGIEYSEICPNGSFEPTDILEGTFSNCANFNQPILDYYFDNVEKRSLDCIRYPYRVNFDFSSCNNFNQIIQGNFYQLPSYEGIYDNGEPYIISSSLPSHVAFNFLNCYVPTGTIKVNWYYNFTQQYSWGYFSPPALDLNFGFMKVSNQETNRTMYFNVIANINQTTEQTLNFNITFCNTAYIYPNWITGVIPEGSDYFFPENFHIDFKRNNTDYPTKVYVSCMDYGFYVGEGEEQNYKIKNFNWFPSSYNDEMFYSGAGYNYSTGEYQRTSSLIYGMDCGYIDIWNTIFNRNNMTNFYQLNCFLDNIYNLKQDFHFEPSTNLTFVQCENVFIFQPDCELNVYINTFDYFNNVNSFISGNNVNVYIKNDLYFNDAYGFFRKNDKYGRIYYSGGNYYIGENTIFNNLIGALPCELKTNLNLDQFNCPQGYDLSYGNYIFDTANSSLLDMSSYNLKIGCFKNTNLHTNMLIINKLPYDYNAENALFYQTKSLFNVKISEYYSGDISATNIFHITYDSLSAQDIANLRANNVIDETNTYMRVYVKRGTFLYYQLSNVRNGINIFQETYYNTRNGNFQNNITYTQDTDGIYYYNNRQGIYYNLYWY